MATVSSLAARLRTELGDMGKSFVYTFVADGTTNRFLIPYSPIQGTTLVIHNDSTDVSTAVEVEEETGYITFDTTPTSGSNIVVAGFYFRYFTDAEITTFVCDAFAQHTQNHNNTDYHSRKISQRWIDKLTHIPERDPTLKKIHCEGIEDKQQQYS